MEPPFGRGTLIQVFVADATAAATRITAAGHLFYVPLRDEWRDWGDRKGGQRAFLMQDTDGYVVMVAQHIGERPLPRG